MPLLLTPFWLTRTAFECFSRQTPSSLDYNRRDDWNLLEA